MKTNLLVIAAFLFFFQTNSQNVITLDLKGEDKPGQKLILVSIDLGDAYGPKSIVIKNGETKNFGFNDIKKIRYEVNNIQDFWKVQSIKNEVYENLSKNGMQYSLRKDWEDEALKYLNELEQNNFVFEDKYLENYLYSLAYKIYPGSIQDGRPGIVNVKIMIHNAPNAFIFPNGSMIITTGLLSTINSEEELIAVMSHEISHFVLDHPAININKAIQRQKNAEFWAAFATTLAAATEVVVSSRNSYYVPGALTNSTAIIATSIASAFIERLGLKYSREQETAADNCAIELMKFYKIDPTALSSALLKIRNYCVLTGNYFALSGDGTHPEITSRINAIGRPNQFKSITYDKLISFVTTTNAINEFNSMHFKACQDLVERNINSGVPTEDDYILKAITNLYLYDTPEKNSECLELLTKAKNLNVATTINVYKQEAIVLIT